MGEPGQRWIRVATGGVGLVVLGGLALYLSLNVHHGAPDTSPPWARLSEPARATVTAGNGDRRAAPGPQASRAVVEPRLDASAATGAPPPSAEGGVAAAVASVGGVLGDECAADSDCPRGSGCLDHQSPGRRRCLPSECELDHHCPKGLVCRTANLAHLGPVVRRCFPIGGRRRGQSCVPWPDTAESACAGGLVCSHLVCGVPCRAGEADGGCAEGEVCLDDGQGDGAACYPLCTRTGCPEGLTCLVLSPTFSRCAKVVGTDCHQAPCPRGQECLTHFTPSEATFECRSPCSPVFGPRCQEGFVCGGGVGVQSYCYQACDPGAPSPSCPSGERCVPVSEDRLLFGCRARSPRGA